MWYSSGTPNDGLKFQRKMKAAARQSGPTGRPSREGGRPSRARWRGRIALGASRTAQAEAANESAGKSATSRKVRLYEDVGREVAAGRSPATRLAP